MKMTPLDLSKCTKCPFEQQIMEDMHFRMRRDDIALVVLRKLLSGLLSGRSDVVLEVHPHLRRGLIAAAHKTPVHGIQLHKSNNSPAMITIDGILCVPYDSAT